jgi:uncharacterized protein YkwD
MFPTTLGLRAVVYSTANNQSAVAPIRNASTIAVRILRRVGLVMLAVAFLSGSDCGSSSSTPSTTTRPLSTPVAAFNYTPKVSNGGASAPTASMNSNAMTLAELIIDYRLNAGISPALSATSTSSGILTGVAQWHAQDMAAHAYVGLVGSDGEDVFTRLANSGYTNSYSGVIADGYSTDPQVVFDALISNYSSDTILLFNGQSFANIGVGYSDGYWMVILGQ